MSEIRVDTISEKTSANGVAVDGVTLKDGGAALTGNLTIDDDSQISLGASADLVIRHNAANGNSFITDAGTGGLFIQANSTLALQSQGTSENFLVGTSDAGVKLYHNNNEKFETTSAGVNVTGTVTSDGASLDGAVVINEASADVDFRVESNGNENMLFVNGGNNLVGIGADPDLGAGLHIKIADSGATATAHGDELVIEDGTSGANVGISILSNANGEARINFGDSDDNDIGGIYYEHVDDRMEFVVNNAVGLNIVNGPKLATYNETAPDVDQGGLCLNQGGDDGAIMTFKSSDIAHGITNDAETDTYATIGKAQGATGGLLIKVMTEAQDSERLVINTNGGGDLITTKSASGSGAIHIGVNNRNGGGTSVTSVNSDGNLLVIKNYTSTQFIFDAEGTFHSNVGTATYDEYDDAQLVRAMDLSTSTKGLIASKFDEFIQYKHEDLADAKIVGRDEDGTPNSMVNWTAMSQLHNGAIWQQYEKTQRLTNAMYELAKAAVGEEKANEILEQNEIKLLN